MLKQKNLYLFKFAWKSIERNAGRSFFIGFSVSLAVVIAVWVVAFFDGMNAQIEKAVVNTNTGYFQIQEPHYAGSTDSSLPREFSPQLQNLLGQTVVSAFSPELILDGNISTPDGAAGLLVIGVEPKLHQRFLPIADHTHEGQFLGAEDLGQVVIGKELAKSFKFQTGDQLVLNYQDHQGELRSELLTIKGIYHYNSRGFEKRVVYINQKTWQQLFFNKQSGKILFNRISLMTPDLEAREDIKIKLSGTDLKLKTWKDLNPEMAVVLDFHDGMVRFFFLIIGVTILMTILTPVRMLWQERVKELKMLNILGVSAKNFWQIGSFEVFQMIFLSSLFSILLLVVIIGIQSQTGIDFSFLHQGIYIERAGIKLPAIIYPKLTLIQVVYTFIFVIFVLGLSYVWSIHRTLKKIAKDET